jgi:hypothetical protein
MDKSGAAASKPRGDTLAASAAGAGATPSFSGRAGAGGASTPAFVGATPPSVPFGIARLQPGAVGDVHGSGGGGGVPAWAWVPRDAEVFAIAEPGQGLADVARHVIDTCREACRPRLVIMVTPPDVMSAHSVWSLLSMPNANVPHHQGPVHPRPRLVLLS